jgi:DNA-binding GntR family transcriptional regulator
MPDTLSKQLIAEIVVYIQSQGLLPGARLPERTLADSLRVSRSPVRSALEQMAKDDLVARRPEGGYVVASAGETQLGSSAPSAADHVYLAIAQDRLEGRLPLRFTENELIRRYGLTRSQVGDVLRRMVHEGWAERLPGYGWTFIEGMTSPEAYRQSYRFRLLLEPSGMLEATFEADVQTLLRCQKEQALLCEGKVYTASPAELFDANTRLHECLALSSGNAFIFDALKRLNRVRRLMEYRKSVDRDQAFRRCQEHLALIELILGGRHQEAAVVMRRHLSCALKEKGSLME